MTELRPVAGMQPGETVATQLHMAVGLAIGLGRDNADPPDAPFSVSLVMTTTSGDQVGILISAEQADKISADLAILAHKLRNGVKIQ